MKFLEKVTCYSAFDGTLFRTKEECTIYENARLLANSEQIIFYADNGKRISDPTEQVLIDSNGFKVFSKEGLIGYHNYCKSLKIEAPEIKESYTYPCHFKFFYGEWICLEDCIEKYKKLLFNSFKEEFLTEEEQDLAHNLV